MWIALGSAMLARIDHLMGTSAGCVVADKLNQSAMAQVKGRRGSGPGVPVVFAASQGLPGLHLMASNPDSHQHDTAPGPSALRCALRLYGLWRGSAPPLTAAARDVEDFT